MRSIQPLLNKHSGEHTHVFVGSVVLRIQVESCEGRRGWPVVARYSVDVQLWALRLSYCLGHVSGLLNDSKTEHSI